MTDPLQFAFLPAGLESYAHPFYPQLTACLMGSSIDFMQMGPQNVDITSCYLTQFPPGQWMRVCSHRGALLPVEAMVANNNVYVRWLNPDGSPVQIDPATIRPVPAKAAIDTGARGPGTLGGMMDSWQDAARRRVDLINSTFRSWKPPGEY